MKLINFFSCKNAYSVNGQDFFQKIFFLTASYGLDTEPEPEPAPCLIKSLNRNCKKIVTVLTSATQLKMVTHTVPNGTGR